MKQFSVGYMTMCGLLALSVLINSTCAIPLSRIVSDSLKKSNSHNNDKAISSPKAASSGRHSGENLALHTEEIPHHKVNTPFADSPSAADENETQQGPSRGSGTPAQPAVDEEAENAVERKRRSAAHGDLDPSEYCTVSSDTPVLQAGDLETFLNATTLLGLNPDQMPIPDIPTNQPQTCSTADNPWWPKPEENLKALCPWQWIKSDLAPKLGSIDIYPRYVKEAKCLCTVCMANNGYNCAKLYKDVTVLQKIGCKNGLAVLVERVVPVVAGCVCQSSVQATTVPSGLASLPTNL